MYKLIKPVLGALVCGTAFFSLSGVAQASPQDIFYENKQPSVLDVIALAHNVQPPVALSQPALAAQATPLPKAAAGPQTHIVDGSDTLSSIAKQYEVSWTRIYDKNTTVTDPDVISAGTELVIPEPEEQLEARDLPLPPPVVVAKNTAATTATSTAYVAARSPASSANRYVAGNCTWYGKDKRPDLPNSLGNARTWAIRARAQGMATGSTPRVGAIGQRGNHVVYVESVNADGTVTVSEMNYKGLYIISSRTVASSSFTYIY